MDAKQLSDELQQANKDCQDCYSCGARCIVRYVPGCTYIYCLGCKDVVRSLPDWQVKRIVDEWND